MDVYQVTTEFGFESEIRDSKLFSDKEQALKYAQALADERRDLEEYYMCCVSVDKLSDDGLGEFQVKETILCHAL